MELLETQLTQIIRALNELRRVVDKDRQETEQIREILDECELCPPLEGDMKSYTECVIMGPLLDM